jgi:hypothetical protein
MAKIQNTTISCVIHHRQNPLEFKLVVRYKNHLITEREDRQADDLKERSAFQENVKMYRNILAGNQ